MCICPWTVAVFWIEIIHLHIAGHETKVERWSEVTRSEVRWREVKWGEVKWGEGSAGFVTGLVNSFEADFHSLSMVVAFVGSFESELQCLSSSTEKVVHMWWTQACYAWLVHGALRWWCCLLKSDMCMPGVELKAGKWRRSAWGCFGYLPSFAVLFVFARRALMSSCPCRSTICRSGSALSCLPCSQRALFRPWSLLLPFTPQNVEAPRAAGMRPTMEMEVELLAERLAGALHTATVTSAWTVAPNVLWGKPPTWRPRWGWGGAAGKTPAKMVTRERWGEKIAAVFDTLLDCWYLFLWLTCKLSRTRESCKMAFWTLSSLKTLWKCLKSFSARRSPLLLLLLPKPSFAVVARLRFPDCHPSFVFLVSPSVRPWPCCIWPATLVAARARPSSSASLSSTPTAGALYWNNNSLLIGGFFSWLKWPLEASWHHVRHVYFQG